MLKDLNTTGWLICSCYSKYCEMTPNCILEFWRIRGSPIIFLFNKRRKFCILIIYKIFNIYLKRSKIQTPRKKYHFLLYNAISDFWKKWNNSHDASTISSVVVSLTRLNYINALKVCGKLIPFITERNIIISKF